MMRTARRKTSLPSIWMNPPTSLYRNRSALPSASRSQPSSCPGPSQASSTTAPEPSANRMAVLRSVQSVIRARLSVPMQRIFFAPMAIRPCAVTSPYMNPEQAALTSNAPHLRPSSAATPGALAGTVRSGVVVARISVSISAGSTPDISMALRPASTDRSVVVPPTWRWWMPVRSTIQSWSVSNMPSRSWLVSTFGGSAVPQPVMTPPRTPCGVAGIRPSSARRSVGEV